MEYVYVFFIFFYGSSRTFLGSGTGVWFIIISRVKYLLRQCFGCIGYFILYYIYVCNGNQQKSSGLMGGKYATECHRSNANFIAMEAWKQEYSAYSTEKKHQKSMLYTRKDVIPSWCYNGVIMVLYLKMVVYHKSMYIIMMLYIRKYVIYQGIPSLHNHRYFASNTRKVIRWYRHVAVILEAVRCRMRCSRSSVAANEKRRHLVQDVFWCWAEVEAIEDS